MKSSRMSSMRVNPEKIKTFSPLGRLGGASEKKPSRKRQCRHPHVGKKLVENEELA